MYFGFPYVVTWIFNLSSGTLGAGRRMSSKVSFFLDKSDKLHQTGSVATSKHGEMGIETAPLGLSKPKKAPFLGLDNPKGAVSIPRLQKS